MSSRWRLLYPLLALALVAAFSAPYAAAPAGRMTVEDVIALLKAGVGEKVVLARIDATGSRDSVTPSVPEILRLKAAGASDDLLAALVGPASSDAAPDGPGNPSFRIYREKNENGEEVLHITNLDASGRRMGGEVAEHTPPNVLRRGESPAPRETEDRYDDAYDEAERQAPVIVNVYPPEPQQPAPPGPGDYFAGTPYYPGVAYPGYFPAYAPGYPGGCRHRGIGFVGYPSPPGSYSHFLLYHHPDGAGLFSSPRAFSTLPYRINNAAARNRAYFRHH